jgi:hypothetical protein
VYMYTYVYICLYVCIYIYTYIYIYICILQKLKRQNQKCDARADKGERKLESESSICTNLVCLRGGMGGRAGRS